MEEDEAVARRAPNAAGLNNRDRDAATEWRRPPLSERLQIQSIGNKLLKRLARPERLELPTLGFEDRYLWPTTRDKDRHFLRPIINNFFAFSQMSASVLDTRVALKTGSKRYPIVTQTERMSNRLTAKTVENIKPSAARREVPDGEIRGMYLVIQPSGAKGYVLRYRHAGKPRKLTIGPAEMGLGEARKLAAGARAVIAAGRDPQGEKAAGKVRAREAGREAIISKRGLVEAVIAEFIEKHVRRSNKPSTAKEYVRLLEKEIIGPWRGRHLSDVSRRDVNLLLDDIVERGAPIAANRVLAILRKFCKWAVSREIISHSPCEGVLARSTETPRDRVVDDRELRLIWNAANTLGWPYNFIVKLLLLTGARRGEVVGMRSAEVDFEKNLRSLPADRVKNKRPHVLPLPSLAIGILKVLPRIENHDGLVFPARTKRGRASPQCLGSRRPSFVSIMQSPSLSKRRARARRLNLGSTISGEASPAAWRRSASICT